MHPLVNATVTSWCCCLREDCGDLRDLCALAEKEAGGPDGGGVLLLQWKHRRCCERP